MDASKLKGKIREKDLTQKDLAEKMGLSLSRFNAKLNGNKAVFTLGEVRAIRKILDLTLEQVDEIFFDEKVS